MFQLMMMIFHAVFHVSCDFISCVFALNFDFCLSRIEVSTQHIRMVLLFVLSAATFSAALRCWFGVVFSTLRFPLSRASSVTLVLWLP